MAASFRDRLSDERPILLDGATGTELHRRGVDTSLPLWSASAIEQAPDVLAAVHRDYASAGAEVITANTFRTHERTLARAGLAHLAAEWTRRAVQIARQAVAGRCWIAGSLAPLEDCYRPDLVPDDAALKREHTRMARHLADAGVDLILVETHNTIREALSATEAAKATGLAVLTSFVCDLRARLLSGESLEDAVRALLAFGPDAILVNCLPVDAVPAALTTLSRTAAGRPIGVYANVGYADPVHGWVNTDAVDPAVYAEKARRWLEQGAKLVGGCCGTTPEHIRRLRTLIDETT